MLGAFIIVVMVVACLLAPVFYPEGYNVQDISQKLQFPSAEHPCGTDNLGRDVLCRLLYGGTDQPGHRRGGYAVCHRLRARCWAP